MLYYSITMLFYKKKFPIYFQVLPIILILILIKLCSYDVIIIILHYVLLLYCYEIIMFFNLRKSYFSLLSFQY